MEDLGEVVATATASALLLPIGVVVTALDGTSAYVGGIWQQLTALSGDACDGLGWRGDDAAAQQALDGWLEHPHPRPPLSLEYCATSTDGLVGWARGWLVPASNSRGEVIAYVGSIQCVTDLARSEARLRQVAEDPSNAIVRIDRAGKITYVSSIFRMLGFPGAQHTGLQMHTIIHPDDLHLFADRDTLFENPDEIRQRRFRAVTRDGAIMWFDAHSHGAVDPITGVVNEIQSSLRDVTEQVEAEQALRESEERFRVLAEAAAEGVCISDSDQIVSANLAFSNMYGYAPDEVVGMPIASLVVAEERDIVLTLNAEEDAVSGEFFALRKDGTRFPAFASSRTTTYRGRSVRVTAITDLTALKLSLALEERRRVARDLHDGLAHELSFIASKTKTATRIAPSAEVLDALASAADRALDEARRAISVLSSGDPPPLPVAIAQTAEDMCERSLVALALEVNADIRVPAYAVENLLRILREAIVNAGRHGLAEKVTVRLWEDDRVHLTIEDDGRGFDPSEPTRGFGLVSMRERARAVGGDLRLASEPLRGTRIEVTL